MSPGLKIQQWYEANGRALPWRDTHDPYKIWVSEIIMQQTRIAQGMDYYLRFVERFPDVHALAASELDEVLKYWEGLGYYSRARNLHATAHYVSETLGGNFPEEHTDLQKLKGIGPYTARAIASFAFGCKVGVIDGNVLRLMSRFLNDSSPINRQSTRKRFQEIIDRWVSETDPAQFNQGVMDIGSTICTPRNPACMECPLEPDCEGRLQGTIASLPVKDKKAVRKVRYFDFYLVADAQNRIRIRRRPDTGLWGGLWEIPNLESPAEAWEALSPEWKGQYLGELKHIFTHFDMMIHVWRISAADFVEPPGTRSISAAEIPIFAFSKAVLKIFDQWLPSENL